MPDRLEGLAAWSESIMVLAFAPDLRTGFSLRLQRHPEHDASWVWLHAIADGRFYAFTDNRLPATPGRSRPDDADVIYEVPGLAVRMVRAGTAEQMSEIRFSAEVGAHESLAAPEGEGPVRLSVTGVFRPGPLKAGALAGRYERAGEVEATLMADGRRHALAVPAKAHEQVQETPRFGTPFTYAMLWGPNASMVGLTAGGRGGGDYETAAGDTPLARFAVAPRAERRRFEIEPRGAAPLTGLAARAFAYEVPIFGRAWQGSIVRATLGPHTLVGMINDWRPEDQTYALSQAPLP
jgi:hypothetical protein